MNEQMPADNNEPVGDAVWKEAEGLEQEGVEGDDYHPTEEEIDALMEKMPERGEDESIADWIKRGFGV